MSISGVVLPPTQGSLAAALAYAQRGWAVLPLHSVRSKRCTCGRADCGSPAKHPLVRHGVHEATTDLATIDRWWRRYPWANVAVATGAISGFWVLDVDRDKGGDDTLHELEARYGALPYTVEAITGSGGRHILFAHPGHPVPNAVAIAPGLDVRGDGGYILVEPSLHASGRRYRWDAGHHPDETLLARAPGWLLELVGTRTPRGPALDWRWAIHEGVPKGRRNVTLTSVVGGLLRAGVRVRDVLDFALWLNERRFRPPLPEAEVLRVVDSIASREARRRQQGGGNAA